MRTCIILLIEIFNLFASFSLAAPTIVTPIDEDTFVRIRKGKDVPRAVGSNPPVNPPTNAAKCVNPPKSIAETEGIPYRRDLDELGVINTRAVTDLGLWCSHNSPVIVQVIMTHPIFGTVIPLLLTEAQGVIIDSIVRPNNAIIVGPFVWRIANGLEVRVWPIHSQRITWGILRAALSATYAAMMANRGGGVGVIRIYDGVIEVARGLIG